MMRIVEGPGTDWRVDSATGRRTARCNPLVYIAVPGSPFWHDQLAARRRLIDEGFTIEVRRTPLQRNA